MLDELKRNGKVILKSLKKLNERGLSISDMERDTPLIRCQIRGAIAYLLGTQEIEEQIFGNAKIYYLA